jgi:hypothetical protein
MKRFIQFAKRDKENLNFGLPDARWSKKHVNNVAKAFKYKNIQYTIHLTGEDAVIRSLVIINTKIDKAVEIAKIAFHAMNIQPSGHFQAYIKGAFDEDYVKELKKGSIGRGKNEITRCQVYTIHSISY